MIIFSYNDFFNNPATLFCSRVLHYLILECRRHSHFSFLLSFLLLLLVFDPSKVSMINCLSSPSFPCKDLKDYFSASLPYIPFFLLKQQTVEKVREILYLPSGKKKAITWTLLFVKFHRFRLWSTALWFNFMLHSKVIWYRCKNSHLAKFSSSHQ